MPYSQNPIYAYLRKAETFLQISGQKVCHQFAKILKMSEPPKKRKQHPTELPQKVTQCLNSDSQIHRNRRRERMLPKRKTVLSYAGRMLHYRQILSSRNCVA